MKSCFPPRRWCDRVAFRFGLAAAVGALALGGCRPGQPASHQGYIEAEFIQVSAPLAGRLDKLAVSRGDRVQPGQPLFTLESEAEQAAVRQAEEALAAARARRDDLRKGFRPSELAALEARLAQARATAELSGVELRRQAELVETKVISPNDYDRARFTHERNVAATRELEAQVETARLGGRADALAATEAEVTGAQAALDRAGWSVRQKSQAAPKGALVFETVFREGEFVATGQPVVVLLPPDQVKVRFFVPEAALASLQPGRTVEVALSGRPTPVPATIAYVSPKPEYTPPVLYNRDNREKLVYRVEARFAPEVAVELHPGQPVDVTPAVGPAP